MRELEINFYKDMLDIYEEAYVQCNYRATRFKQMVANEGGVKTAKKLICKNGGTAGFEKLYEYKRLDLSVEALVCQEKYKELFTEEEITMCKERLKEYGYDVEK